MAKIKPHEPVEDVHLSSATSSGDTGPVEIIWVNILENNRVDVNGVPDKKKRVYFATRDSLSPTAPIVGYYFDLIGKRAWLNAIIDAFENGTYVRVAPSSEYVTLSKNDDFSEVGYIHNQLMSINIHYKVARVS
jgi:hypothetical protein